MYSEEQHKDLALITSIIINADVLGGTVFQTFDTAYDLAKRFQVLYDHDFNWDHSEQNKEFDEAIIDFVDVALYLNEHIKNTF